MALSGGSGGGARGIEAGRAFVRLGAKDDLSAHLKRVAGRFAALGKSILGFAGVTGLLNAALGAVTLDRVLETLLDLRKMDDVAKAFGITGKAASGLFGLLGAVGGEFKENLEGVIQFSDTINQALAGGSISEGARLFDGLAITAKEIEGLAVDEQFYRVLGAIRQLPQPLQEAKLALLGGTDSMKQWQPLLTMSAEEARRMAQYMSLSNDELAQAANANRAYMKSAQMLNRVWQQAVVILAPFIQNVATGLLPVLTRLFDFLRDRSLGDLFGELVGRIALLAVDAKHAFINSFVGVWDFFTGGWNSAVLVVKNLFIDLAEFMRATLTDAIRGPLMGLSVIAPDLAAAIKLALGAGGSVASVMRKQAQDEFDRAETLRRMTLQIITADQKAERGAIAGGIAAINEAVAKRRRQRELDDLMNTPLDFAAKKAAATAGRSLGTFGGSGSLFKQAFGAQAGEGVAKKQLNEQKKGNVLLKDVVKAVQEIPVPRFL